MKFMPAFFLLLGTPLMVLAQPFIKGRVVNVADGSPVAGGSVFVSNTSKGTTTDRDGYFELNDLPAGKHQLVVSCVGYETNAFSFSGDQLPLQLKIEMTVKVKELKNVTVEPFTEETWEKWGKTFIDYFIGQTPNAAQCRIRNPDVIRFRYYKKSNRLVALADEPIILENKALGYRIKYQLEDFQVGFSAQMLFFSGYTLYEELGEKKKWQRARDKAYYGSMMHFLKCVYRDSLAQQGFEVRRMVRINNSEKTRVKAVYREIHLPGRDSLRLALKDSMEYYESVFRQPDYRDIVGRDILPADSLVIEKEGAYKYIYFPDYLYVTYKNELEEQEYVDYWHEKRSRTFQRSYMRLVNGNAVAIDVNGGYYPPDELFSMAYWGWSEKMANCLPVDYAPYGAP